MSTTVENFTDEEKETIFKTFCKGYGIPNPSPDFYSSEEKDDFLDFICKNHDHRIKFIVNNWKNLEQDLEDYDNRFKYGISEKDNEGSYYRYVVFPSSITPEEAIASTNFYAFYRGAGRWFSNGPYAYTKGTRTIVKCYYALDI